MKLFFAASLVVAAVFFIFVGYVGLIHHPIEDSQRGNPEEDFYPYLASVLAQGKLPGDAFRPLLYHFLSALIGTLINDYFRACQIVSVVSACLFVWLTYLLGKRLSNPLVGLLAMLMVAINVEVCKAAVRAATDMLYSCLTLACLYALISLWPQDELVDPPPRKRAIYKASIVGVLFGLAFVTRYQALFILPAVLFAFWLHNRQAESHAAAATYEISVFLLTAVGIATPQLIANYLNFHSLIPSDNFRNMSELWFGLGGQDHLVFFQSHTKEEFIRRIMDQPLVPVAVILNNIWGFLISRLPVMLAGSQVAGIVLLACALYYLVGRMTKKVPIQVVLAFLGGNLLGTGCTCSIEERMTLPWLVICVVGLNGFLLDRMRGHRRLGCTLIVAVFGFMLIWNARDLHYFIQNHPIDDLKAANFLLQLPVGKGDKVMGTCLYIRNHVPLNYVSFDGLRHPGDKFAYDRKLIEALSRERPTYLITSENSPFGFKTPTSLLSAPNEAFPFLEIVKVIGTAIIYRVDYANLPDP